MNTAERSSSPQFRFDRQLWNRFIEIAQPYFFPIERNGSKAFLGLLLLVLLLVVSTTFFVAVGLTKLGEVLFPAFFTNLAAPLVERVNGLVRSPALPIALGTLIIGGLIIAAFRSKLQSRWRQWSLLWLLLFLSFAVNGMNVTLSYVFRFVDNALNQRDENVFWQLLLVYIGILVIAVPVIVLYRYIRLKLGLFWREWLTQLFFDRYFSNRAYYELDSNAANTEIDNPDQRITEDIKSFSETTLHFLLDILDSILTLISFIAILYSISRVLTLGLLIYAVLGTGVAVIAGQKLIKINFNQLRLEGNFRYGMVHVRDNAESIAFYRGENLERQQVTERLIEAIRNFDLLIIWQAIIELFQYAYNYFTRVVPYLIVAPLYFAGETDFGTITQAVLAFREVLRALSIITNQIDTLSRFAASINRLGEFYERLDVVAVFSGRGGELESYEQIQLQNNGPALKIHDLTLRTPNSEQTLVEHLSLEQDGSDRLLIVGTSGCGKSSLMRAIAGLWRRGQGTIIRPDPSNTLFLPQRPYMLLGSLKEQIIYPNIHSTISDDEIHAILNRVNLPNLVERVGGLDVERDWPSVLSLGEQQRLAFARILVSQPQYVMLDEATSALDVNNENELYKVLQNMDVVYVSVGHRPSLIHYHNRVLVLSTDAQRWDVVAAENYQFA